MPRPTVVSSDVVPERRGTRTKSTAQKVVDAYVTEARPMLEDLVSDPSREDAVLLHFTTEDDDGFAFTSTTRARLQDRCRRMVRAAMKEHLPTELDDAIEVTYDIPVTKHTDEALAVDGFRAFLSRKQ